MTTELILSNNELQKKIHIIRGAQVMLDRDLAELYEVKPIRLREQVKRNSKRFPEDFMFQLTMDEVEIMVSQNAIPSKQYLGGTLPYVFTEQGVAAISGILTSDRAIAVNISIMRTFVEMRRFLANNSELFKRLDTLEQRQVKHEIKTTEQFDKVFDALEDKNQTITQGIFFDGQMFDAYVFINDLFRQAKRSIILIDNYIDDSVLMQLTKRPRGVSATILTKSVSKDLTQDLKKHNAQYPPIVIHEFASSHDRFLIIDGETVYHIGASLKDLGKKWFAFSRMDATALTIMGRIDVLLKQTIGHSGSN
ncbi:MAG: ORF6N domain-containing protein [Legionellaceae bacterium]|nr:ORF6N domain-containing protein [Legionellaceae bacterium]